MAAVASALRGACVVPSVATSTPSAAAPSRRLFHASAASHFDSDRKKTLRQLVMMRPIQTAGGIFYPSDPTSLRSATLDDFQPTPHTPSHYSSSGSSSSNNNTKSLFIPTTCGLLYRVDGATAAATAHNRRQLVEVLDCKSVTGGHAATLALVHREALVVVQDDEDEDEDVQQRIELIATASTSVLEDDEPSLAELLRADSAVVSSNNNKSSSSSILNIDGEVEADAMMMTNVLKKRRRKMNRHKYKKWRKRMRFKLRAQR